MGLNDNFANIRGQILNMKPRPGLTAIYNMLDQDESQRNIGGSPTSIVSNPTAFQVQTSANPDQSHALLSHGGPQKPKCSHCHKTGHTADKCYKLHGYPPGSGPKWKKSQTVGAANLTTSEQDIETNTQDELSNDQIQTMISYLSSKLHSSSVEGISNKPCASTSTSAPVVSQISGTYTGIDDWSR
ncbi:uncharacterized protein LOC112088164 [Eutrema salsugineum]|uniref:uncharacterized protein LOC112088164 n=1 Tax=Eutrema salsugineum TaxID=72664 RepID=UPI000CED7682|nr:uncharacterized protein LOC112088164 [Eutrema salsugineum]